ncbi:MAG: tetratricopeptide repeat protein [Cyanobacteria bacterium TGS_CYA1]|nr:tetratricopeptide repeat protein [Cyanobacteria bacterium TGS_CYA1]
MTKAPKILLSISCLLATTTSVCIAADGPKTPKQIYVPASQIPRRYDSEMFYGTEAVPTSSSSSNLFKAPSIYGKPQGKSTSSASALSTNHKPLPVKKVAKPPVVYKKTSDPFVQQTGSQFQSELAIKHADALIAQGKLKDAQAVLMKVQRTFPGETKLKDKIAQVSVLRSHHYLKTGDHLQAASQSRMALAFDTNSEKAKDSLDQALKGMNIDPASSQARLKQGHTLYSQGKTLEAAIEYRAALHNSPQLDSHSEALVGLGNIAAHHKDVTNAKANYEAALQQNPNSSSALRQYGLFQYKQNELINANRNLSKALIVNPADAAAKEKLIELWQQQVAVRPNDAITHLGMARAYQLAGDLKSAQAEYKTVVKIDPNHPNLAQARESFKIALTEQEARRHLEAAHTLEDHNALHEAFGKASEAARITPNNVQTKLYQAHLAERIGNYKDAKAFYLSALTLDPNNATASVGVRKYANILATGEHPIELKAQAGNINGGATDSFDSFNSGRRIEGPRNWSFGVPPNSPDRYTGTEEPPDATLPAFPMTMQGAPATGASPAQYRAANARYGLTPGTIYQVPSGDPLTNMAGFMGQLRNHMVSEKQKWKDWEDQVHDNMKPQSAAAPSAASNSSTSSSVQSLLNMSPGSSAPAALNTPSTANAATSPTGNKLITSGDVAALLQSLKKGKTTAAPVVTQTADKATATAQATASAATSALTSTAAPVSAPPVAPPIQTQSKLNSVVNALSNAAAGRPLLAQPYNYTGYPMAYNNPYAPYNPQPIVPQQMPLIDPMTGKALPTNLTQPQSQNGIVTANTVNNGTNWAALAATAGQVAYQNRGAIKAAAANAAQKMQPLVENVKQSLNQINTAKVSETTKATLLPTTTNETTSASSTSMSSTNTVSTMEALNQAAVPAEITPSITKASDENAIALAPPESLTSESPSAAGSGNSELTRQTPQFATTNQGSDKIAALENQNSQLREQLEKAQAQLKNNSAYRSPFSQGGVRLELLGVSSTEKTTTLNVLLKNDQNSEMKLPSSMRAVVRLIGTPDQVAKVKFDKKALNANETVKGTITVHAPKLSPAADVLIPNMMSASDGSKQDLHLTVPISSNFGVNK